jgi:hypothetical protein
MKRASTRPETQPPERGATSALRPAAGNAIRGAQPDPTEFAWADMDTILKTVATVASAMLHNYPVLESIVILPLLLKRYLWVLIGCVLVMLLTFGVERSNNYAISNLLSAQAGIFATVQIIITVGATIMIFLVKQILMRGLNVSRSGAPKAD